jgi:hypothetical protein
LKESTISLTFATVVLLFVRVPYFSFWGEEENAIARENFSSAG